MIVNSIDIIEKCLKIPMQGVSGSRTSKMDRQYNGQKPNNDLQNTTQKDIKIEQHEPKQNKNPHLHVNSLYVSLLHGNTLSQSTFTNVWYLRKTLALKIKQSYCIDWTNLGYEYRQTHTQMFYDRRNIPITIQM